MAYSYTVKTQNVETQLNGSVLIVDDDPAFREILTLALEEIGLKVRGVSTGVEAMDQMRGTSFSLVITDLQMPQLDGISLLKELKNAHIALPPVILITANSHWLPETEPEGVVATFAKPFSAAHFLTSVREAIKNSKRS